MSIDAGVEILWTLAGVAVLGGTFFAALRVPPSRVRTAWALWVCGAICWLGGAIAGDVEQTLARDALWWLFAFFALAGLAYRSPPGRFSFGLFTLDALPIVLLGIAAARIAAGQTVHDDVRSQLFSG